ncbi:MAG: NAD-dependent epimerase/dehydratase family protein [Clostridia bacterium]|nr:NAD-dependent epimerase/dehydratase family protein [Clostridia bacterium]
MMCKYFKKEDDILNKKICVLTGASGHVGYAMLKELVANGENVRILIRKDNPIFDNIECEKVYGDVTDLASLEKAFYGADIVYHFAGVIDVNTGNEDIIYKVNVDGTKNVVYACKKCGVRRLAFTSSVDAIPPLLNNEVMSEINKFSPELVEGTYAKTKAIATQYVLDNASENFEVVIGHPAACIGPYDFKVSNVGEMVRMFMLGSFPVTMDFGAYNFVDVRDIANGMYLAAQKAKSGECFIFSGEVLKIDDFISILSIKCASRKPSFVLKKWMASSVAPIAEVYYKVTKKTPIFTRYSIRKLVSNCNFSYEKAKKELGYNPISAKESLNDMVDWIKDNDTKTQSVKKNIKNNKANINFS